MRTNTIVATADFRFIVTGGIAMACGERTAYIPLGTKGIGNVRISIGTEFAKGLPDGKTCSRDGDGTIGLCEECATVITRDKVTMVEDAVGHFKQARPTAKHGSVKTMYRASAFLTRKSSALMVAEERHDSGEVMALFHVEGGSPMLWLDTETEERKPFHKQAKIYDGKKVVGLDAFVVLRKGDKIAISRSTDCHDCVRHEMLSIIVTDDLQVKLVEATKSDVPKNEPAPAEEEAEVVAAPEVEEEAPEEELKEEEETEISFEQ